MNRKVPAVAKTANAEDAAITRLRPLLTWPAWFSALVLILFSHFSPGTVTRLQWIPFVASIVLLGLPHGAWDHHVMPTLQHRPLRRPFLIRFVLGYGLLVAAYGVFWYLTPGLAFAAFIVLSWLHWGQGDAWYLHVFGGRKAASPGEQLLIWLVRGGLPIALPILAFPATFRDVLLGMTTRFGVSSTAPWGALLSTPGRLTGFGLLSGLTLLYVYTAWRAAYQTKGTTRGKAAFWHDVGEVALLWVWFATVPPPLAVGVYFGIWHGARHIARLCLSDQTLRHQITTVDVWSASARFGGQSLPILIAALGLLLGLWLVYAPSVHDLSDFVYLYLAYIAALTFPHFLLVLWMDRQQSIFTLRQQAPAPTSASEQFLASSHQP